MVVLELEFCVGLGGNRRWLGGNAPENHSSSLLHGFQTLAEKISVSMPELDVVGGCGSGRKPDCLADYEGHSLGLCLADLLGRQRATVAPVQHLVSLCCRQHKRIYVAPRFMWRSPRGGPEDAHAHADKRHITSRFTGCEGTP